MNVFIIHAFSLKYCWIRKKTVLIKRFMFCLRIGIKRTDKLQRLTDLSVWKFILKVSAGRSPAET
ncbi:hypothetical protein EG339_16215 [Chryseobacterium bernardetii]|uniref:Uncharacterized protein n=1 Tax=Chryseobacterium bernardetii TaxID=1241978 RepID=A0A3G6T9W4_9FLAO|nr:hypothetical protein EG339_16215 [Chryseobacterium bernardetii]